MDPADNLEIIPMTVSHVPSVLRIERAVFRDAWSEAAFLDALNISDKCWVAMSGDETAGYLLTQWVLDEIHIFNVAVAPQRQRQNVASRMMEFLLDLGTRSGMRYLFLEVRVSNTPAIALYERFGFRELAIRRKYYADGEDARVMHRDLTQDADGEADWQWTEKFGEREG
jgi:[ribosomal protein S18]-alanine N-acetyltransferase